MPRTEGQWLQQATTEAFRKAGNAFNGKLQPGTPEWDEWQKPFNMAVAANDAYTAYLRANQPKPQIRHEGRAD
jgi:hypothetical protein